MKPTSAKPVAARSFIDTHVLQEYCNVALKRLKLPTQHIRAQLDLYEQFEVVQVTPAVIRAGLDLHQTRSVAFYDAPTLVTGSRWKKFMFEPYMPNMLLES